MKALEFLQEDNGNFSSNRLTFFLWAVGALLVWGISSLKSGTLVDIPETVTVLIGILMSGKVIQKFGEKSAITPAE